MLFPSILTKLQQHQRARIKKKKLMLQLLMDASRSKGIGLAKESIYMNQPRDLVLWLVGENGTRRTEIVLSS
jgi:hypothetical protein